MLLRGRVLFIIILNVVMLGVIMKSVIAPSDALAKLQNSKKLLA